MDDEASIEIEERVFSYNFDLKEWKDVGVVIPEGDLVSKYIAGVVKKSQKR